MNPILKNILSVLGGLIIGSIINGGIIFLGMYLIPLPNGIDPMDPEALKAAIPNFGSKHFIAPFFAHALGTLTGAWFAARMGASRQLTLALIIGLCFLAGGIANVFQLGGPIWFTILDLLGAYIPMAVLGWRLAVRPK